MIFIPAYPSQSSIAIRNIYIILLSKISCINHRICALFPRLHGLPQIFKQPIGLKPKELAIVRVAKFALSVKGISCKFIPLKQISTISPHDSG